MRILFVTSNRLGDAVLSTGLLDHLIRVHPDARITVVCGPVAEGIFARMPNRERTIILRKQPRGRHWLPLWAATATTFWDLVVDIRGSTLAWLVPTRRRAVFRRTGGPKVAELASVLKLSPPPSPVTWTAPEDERRIDTLLPPGRKFIALAPTANWGPKIWPADRLAACFRALAEPGTIPLVLGGPGEAEHALAEPLLAALPEAIDVVGRLTLPEAAACLARASLFIGNDSGLMHLSAAAGAPTIGLFGPTDATVYGPTGRCAVAVVAASMDAISVDRVVTTARGLLNQLATGQPAIAVTSAAKVVSTPSPAVSS